MQYKNIKFNLLPFIKNKICSICYFLQRSALVELVSIIALKIRDGQQSLAAEIARLNAKIQLKLLIMIGGNEALPL